MAAIYKHGKGWRAQVVKSGVRRSKTFRTQSEARDWAAQQEHLIASQTAPNSKLPFKDVMDRYAREVSSGKAGAKWEQIRLERFMTEDFARKPIGDLVPEDFAVWRDRRLAEVQPGSVIREMTLLSAVLHRARKEWRLIERSPLTDAARPRQPRSRDRRPSKAELEALAFIAGRNYERATARVYAAFLFACETAMRAGEIASLSSETVSYKTRVAHLAKTKNGEARDVPLSSRAVEILQSMPDQERLFNVSADQISALFQRLRKRANVHGLTFHDSRREGTVRLSKKLEVLDLARCTGHRDINMLMVYYNEDAAALARKLD